MLRKCMVFIMFFIGAIAGASCTRQLPSENIEIAYAEFDESFNAREHGITLQNGWRRAWRAIARE